MYICVYELSPSFDVRFLVAAMQGGASCRPVLHWSRPNETLLSGCALLPLQCVPLQRRPCVLCSCLSPSSVPRRCFTSFFLHLHPLPAHLPLKELQVVWLGGRSLPLSRFAPFCCFAEVKTKNPPNLAKKKRRQGLSQNAYLCAKYLMFWAPGRWRTRRAICALKTDTSRPQRATQWHWRSGVGTAALAYCLAYIATPPPPESAHMFWARVKIVYWFYVW